MNKIVILDRDGVINQDSKDYIKSPEEWHALPGSLEGIAMLKKAGFIVSVATNQSGIGRGYFKEATLHQIHDKMKSQLKKLHAEIDYIAYCPHLPAEQCFCRKPNPGLIQKIMHHFKTTPQQTQTFFIGDSAKDIEAAQNADCIPILVKTGNGQQVIQENPKLSQNINVFENLHAAALHLVQHT